MKTTGAMVTSLEVDKKNTILISSDSSGFLFVWNIDGYCLTEKATEPPECKCIQYILATVHYTHFLIIYGLILMKFGTKLDLRTVIAGKILRSENLKLLPWKFGKQSLRPHYKL